MRTFSAKDVPGDDNPLALGVENDDAVGCLGARDCEASVAIEKGGGLSMKLKSRVASRTSIGERGPNSLEVSPCHSQPGPISVCRAVSMAPGHEDFIGRVSESRAAFAHFGPRMFPVAGDLARPDQTGQPEDGPVSKE